MKKLGVNIDHVATLRNARGESFPCPVEIALLAEKAGADNITCHLREDRRHVKDTDAIRLREEIQTSLNFEMAATEEMLAFALDLKPDVVTIVPERREEVTTEGGLDLFQNQKTLGKLCEALAKNEIKVSFFIESDQAMIAQAKKLGATEIEFHTGKYAHAFTHDRSAILKELQDGASYAKDLGLFVHAGHGLDLHNLAPLAKIDEIESFQIGFAIVAQSLIWGIDKTIQAYKNLL